MTSCRICGNKKANNYFAAREMMFGLRHEFLYFECSDCGCLQIEQVPANLSFYYPQNYYAYQNEKYVKENCLISFLRRERSKNCLGERNVVGIALSRVFGNPDCYEWMKKAKLTLESEILDVGCGTGHLINRLHRAGFSQVTGIDPLMNCSVLSRNGPRILKKEIAELPGHFDFIMFNHSFEHMQYPLLVFKELNRLSKSYGHVLIRTPVASSYAWRNYGANWVQLDAPRHLFLHTEKSILILAQQTGFQITEVTYDSTEFQFWGSEQYKNDIPLNDSRSYAQDPETSLFSPGQIRNFKMKALELNKSTNGDSACFYLRKVN